MDEEIGRLVRLMRLGKGWTGLDVARLPIPKLLMRQ